MISDGSKREAGSMPSPGFTQKATIDVSMNEIHILAVCSYVFFLCGYDFSVKVLKPFHAQSSKLSKFN